MAWLVGIPSFAASVIKNALGAAFVPAIRHMLDAADKARWRSKATAIDSADPMDFWLYPVGRPSAQERRTNPHISWGSGRHDGNNDRNRRAGSRGEPWYKFISIFRCSIAIVLGALFGLA